MYCYERRFPEEGEVVMCKVMEIAIGGARLELLEYGDIEAMIPISELSRRKIQIKTSIPVGRIDPVIVLCVDEDRGYIDCSKRQLSAEEAGLCRDRFARNKFIHNLWSSLNHRYPIDEDLFYRQVVYPLQKTGDVIDQIKSGVSLDVDPELLKCLREIVEDKTRVPLKKHRFMMQLICKSSAGIDGIIASIKVMQDQLPGSKVRYISCGYYALEIENRESNDILIPKVKQTIEMGKSTLKNSGGVMILETDLGSYKVKDLTDLEDIAKELANKDRQNPPQLGDEDLEDCLEAE